MNTKTGSAAAAARACLARLAGALALALSPAFVNAAAWSPDSAVEIVVPSGPGSGLDTTARSVQRIMQAKRLLPVASTVVNKPGGGGTLAYLYVNQHPGNASYVSITSPGVVTNKIVGAAEVDYRDLTPLAQLFEENIAFMVRPDSRFKTARELVDQLKKDPASVTFGIATALGGANHIAAASALKAAGVDVKRVRNVVYKSGGEVTTALLGAHLDVVPIAAPVALRQLEAGKVRVLAVSSPERLTGAFASVPTWRELGVDSTYSSWRGVVGPRGLTAEQVAYWDGVFAKLAALDEWKQELEKRLWVPTYLDSAHSRAFLEQQRKEHHAILTELGLAK
jgi:putative tricarboxylic transport membrane protein